MWSRATSADATIGAQIASLVSAWEWRPSDHLLLTLPLHHVHGIINGLGSALAVRATCEICRFEPEAVWDRLASGDITVFTAVPTMYHRLIASWDAAPPDVRRARSMGVGRLRLMMSGSAALPVQTLERWREISGHTLLERYGMTEIGMALANPLDGDRRPGFVGTPLPGVDVRLVDEDGAPVADGEPGELEVRGPTVFSEYWQRPDETRAAFRDGWFRTGDVARARERLVSTARPHQRGHHQDGRIQGVRARDRRVPADAPGHRRMRHRRRGRSGMGRTRVARRRAEARAPSSASTSCSAGPGRTWLLTRSRGRWLRRRRFRGTPWEKL